jgi:hypothetical protein
MSEQIDDESLRAAENRVQPFLDCVAYLLAKRCLLDQRQSGDKPPQKHSESDTEPFDDSPEDLL